MKIKLAWLFLYVWIHFVRSWTSPIIYGVVRRFMETPEKRWIIYNKLSIKNFDKAIGKLKYISDPIGGLLDFTLKDPNLFLDPPFKYSRDCDDFAYTWHLWAKEHNLKSWIIYLMDGVHISSAHACTIIKIGEKYVLCNFTIEGHYKSIEHALNQFKKRPIQSYGIYPNLVWTVGKHHKPKGK